MIFETNHGPHLVSLLYTGDRDACILIIRNQEINVTLVDDVFDNALLLSATLRDTFGLADSIEVLHRFCITPNSDLWDLNHSRPFDRVPPRERFEGSSCEPDNPPGPEYNFLDDTGWSTYEECEYHFLYEHPASGQLFFMRTGSCVMLSPSEYEDELETISYRDWREMVERHDAEEEVLY